jgi:hypothetical protein
MDTTPKHCIYIMSNPGLRPGLFKVGLTGRHVNERIKELKSTGLPSPYELEGYVAFAEGVSLRKVESIAHRKLKAAGYHFDGELFSFPDDVDPVEYVRGLIAELPGCIGSSSLIPENIVARERMEEREEIRARHQEQRELGRRLMRKAAHDLERQRANENRASRAAT